MKKFVLFLCSLGCLLLGSTFVLNETYANSLPPNNIQGTVTVSEINNQGKFTVRVSDLVAPTGVKTIEMPLWSDNNGQDDKILYTPVKQSDGSYLLTVDIRNHKGDLGGYTTHVYLKDLAGQTTLLGIGTTSVKANSFKTATSEVNNQGEFTITISDIVAPLGLTQIRMPLWWDSDQPGTVKEYIPVKQSDGTYKVSVKLSELKNHAGNYTFHLYMKDNLNIDRGYYGGAFKIPEPTGKVSVSEVDNQGKFTVRLTDLIAPTGIKTIEMPLWSDNNGQDDKILYTPVKQSDGSYLLTVDMKNHKNDLGGYTTHVYLEDLAGKKTLIGLGSTTVKPITFKTTASEVSNQGELTITISDIDAPRGLTQIRMPLWWDGDQPGTVKEYIPVKQSDGTYKVSVKLSELKNHSGNYTFHLYMKDNLNIDRGYYGGAFKIPEPTGKVSVSEVDAQGKFTIRVTDIVAPTGVKTIEMPLWSELNGQDDKVLYTPVKQSDGSYLATVDIKNHKGDLGVYTTHVYLEDLAGQKILLGLGSTTVKPITFKTTASEVSNQGELTITISDIVAPRGLTNIRMPLWWDGDQPGTVNEYIPVKQSDGTYKVTIKVSNHKNNSGGYSFHLYMKDNQGIEKGYYGGAFNVPFAKGSLEFGEIVNNTFTVKLNNIQAPTGLLNPTFYIWSDVFGQDDKKGYPGVKQGDGSYLVTVDTKAFHNLDKGNYNVHVYGTSLSNKFDVVAVGAKEIPQVKGEVEISPLSNPPTRTFDVVYKNLVFNNLEATPIVYVKSKSGVKTYEAVLQENGTYKTTVDIKDHNYDGGLYEIDATMAYKGGGNSLLAKSEVNVPVMKASKIEYTRIDEGCIQVKVSGIDAPAGVQEIIASVYGDYKGDSDRRNYTLIKNADGSYSTKLYIRDHGYEAGMYSIEVTGKGTDQVKAVLGNGKVDMAGIQGKVSVSGITNEGDFTVSLKLSNIPRGVTELRAIVWVDGLQAETRKTYYLSYNADGTYKASGNASEFGERIGKYMVHVYGVDNYRFNDFVDGTEFTINSVQGKFLWPVPSCTSISSPYGMRWGSMHRGIDIPGNAWAPVVAARAGVVISAGDNGDGFGNKVIIDHGNGVQTLYGHLNAVDVYNGQVVFRGAQIGRIGNTGQSFGNHLHFQVTTNSNIYTDTVDPMNFF